MSFIRCVETVDGTKSKTTWVAAPHDRHFVFQGQARKGRVGLAVLQHHVEVALLMRRLPVRQRHFGDLPAVFVVLHLHLLAEALGGCVIDKVHGVVVHAWHREVPLHLLVIGEIAGIVGCDKLGLRYSPRQGDLHDGQSWRSTRGKKPRFNMCKNKPLLTGQNPVRLTGGDHRPHFEIEGNGVHRRVPWNA